MNDEQFNVEDYFPGALGGSLPENIMPPEKVELIEKFLDSCKQHHVMHIVDFLSDSKNWPEHTYKAENGKYSTAYKHFIERIVAFNKEHNSKIQTYEIMRVLGGNFNLRNHPASKVHEVKLREFQLANNGEWKGLANHPLYANLKNRARRLKNSPGIHPDYNGQSVSDYINALTPDLETREGRDEICDAFVKNVLGKYADRHGIMRNIPQEVNDSIAAFAKARKMKVSEFLKEHTPYVKDNAWIVTDSQGDYIADVANQLHEEYGQYGIFDIAGITTENHPLYQRLHHIASHVADPEIKNIGDVLKKYFSKYHMSTKRDTHPRKENLTEEFIREEIARDIAHNKKATEKSLRKVRRFARQNGRTYDEMFEHFDLDNCGTKEVKTLTRIYGKE